MKKSLIALVVAVLTMFVANAAFAGGDCPQKRKTKKAPGSVYSKDKTAKADAKKGKDLYTKKAKPMACQMCHGAKGAGDGQLGKALKPAPRNFTCAKTMADVTPGQMFHIIKNGSPGTGMAPFGKTLSDKDIWNVVKYIREELMK
ncbi:c-type cytochrome [Nitrospina sp. 32_T5]|uniref:c-type cytochrome n=1 Tax=unclassified Nitrospina TaxID=2638683 RepID=UPI003F97990B